VKLETKGIKTLGDVKNLDAGQVSAIIESAGLSVLRIIQDCEKVLPAMQAIYATKGTIVIGLGDRKGKRDGGAGRMALVFSYGKGHSALSEEKSMGSVAGFSWRLLCAVFLEKNSDLT
jgi:hypothetical protein